MAWYNWVQAFRDLSNIQKSLDGLKKDISKILTLVGVGRPPTSVRIEFGRSQLLDKKGKLIMSGSANVTTDHDLRVPLVWKDDVGTVSAPTSGTSASSDNPSVATVDVAADDLSVVVRSVALGTCNIAVSNGALSDTIIVNVTDPAATVLDVDATDAKLIAKGTPA